jgi:hypothetical protein
MQVGLVVVEERAKVKLTSDRCWRQWEVGACEARRRESFSSNDHVEVGGRRKQNEQQRAGKRVCK